MKTKLLNSKIYNKVYLDYFNNYLSIERFVSDRKISIYTFNRLYRLVQKTL